MKLRVDIVTIFPGMFEGVLAESMLRIAREKQILEVQLWNPRDYTTDKHRSVDDRPFGGGPGMVMKVEPISKAVRDICGRFPDRKPRILLPCPQGRVFKQAMANELARESHLIFIACHYEGYDERILELLGAEIVSLGDFVLTGGELPTLVMLDALTRLIPGVLGDAESASDESFSIEDGHGDALLEYPQYTRPASFEGMEVPPVLLSGDHEKIRAWRIEQSRLRTERFRPDLITRNKFSKE